MWERYWLGEELGRAMRPWHELDEFWEAFGPTLFAQEHWSAAPIEVNGIISLLQLQPGMSILDLCCGPGRHSLELARRGFYVTGVDRTRRYLDRGATQAEREGLQIEFVHEEMRNFCRPSTFDAVINVYTSFGYFENPQEDRQVAMNISRSLKPGGVLVMEMMGKEVLARVFQERSWHEEDGVLILEERKIRNGWDWIDSRWILFQDGRRIEKTVSLRLYSAAELTSLLATCGFARAEVYGDLAGSAYDHTAKRLVVVGHK